MVALKEIARAYSAHHSERSCSALAPAPEWWTATPSRSLLQVGCAYLESRWSRFDLGWALGEHRRAHRWASARGRPHAKGAGSGAAVGPTGQQERASICAARVKHLSPTSPCGAAWPGSKFREFFIEIWVGPTFGRNSSKVGRPSAQERKGRTFEKVLCFASGLRIQDPRIHSH